MAITATAPTLIQMLNRTPTGRIIAQKIAAHNKKVGTGPNLMGRGFNFMKTLHNIGKITSKITGPLAKKICGLVGIPPSLVDDLAKSDPTTSAALHAALAESKAGKQVIERMSPKPGIKPIYLIAGAAVLGFFLLKK